MGTNIDVQMVILRKTVALLPPAESCGATITRSASAGGQHNTLELVFETDTAETKTFVFAKKPLGFNFLMSAPITVKKLAEDSVARRLGVQEGWILRGIAGVDVSGTTIEDQYATLKAL